MYHVSQEASHVLSGTKSLHIGGRPVSVAYASKSMLHERPAWAQSAVAKANAAQTSSQVQAYGKIDATDIVDMWRQNPAK